MRNSEIPKACLKRNQSKCFHFAFNFLLIFLVTLESNFCYADDILSTFKDQLKYFEERDKIISQNIANSDTPGYSPKELLLNNSQSEGIKMAKTNPMHISSNDVASDFYLQEAKSSEIKPNGNKVSVDQELFKKSENSLRMQETLNVYNKYRSMLKTSIMGK